MVPVQDSKAEQLLAELLAEAKQTNAQLLVIAQDVRDIKELLTPPPVTGIEVETGTPTTH
jgi:hypothetical protein